MPWFGDDEPIIESMDGLIREPDRRLEISRQLRALVAPLSATRASERTAELAEQILGEPHQ
jgi:hypothetical protein